MTRGPGGGEEDQEVAQEPPEVDAVAAGVGLLESEVAEPAVGDGTGQQAGAEEHQGGPSEGAGQPGPDDGEEPDGGHDDVAHGVGHADDVSQQPRSPGPDHGAQGEDPAHDEQRGADDDPVHHRADLGGPPLRRRGEGEQGGDTERNGGQVAHVGQRGEGNLAPAERLVAAPHHHARAPGPAGTGHQQPAAAKPARDATGLTGALHGGQERHHRQAQVGDVLAPGVRRQEQDPQHPGAGGGGEREVGRSVEIGSASGRGRGAHGLGNGALAAGLEGHPSRTVAEAPICPTQARMTLRSRAPPCPSPLLALWLRTGRWPPPRRHRPRSRPGPRPCSRPGRPCRCPGPAAPGRPVPAP